jgi:hypothetical protein
MAIPCNTNTGKKTTPKASKILIVLRKSDGLRVPQFREMSFLSFLCHAESFAQNRL